MKVKIGSKTYYLVKRKAFWGSDVEWEAHAGKPDAFSDITYVTRAKTKSELFKKLRRK